MVLVPIILLSACSTQAALDRSSSSSISSHSSRVEMPSKSALRRSIRTAQKYDQVEMADQENKDANIRYSDIVGSQNREKYTGKLKIVGGEVFAKKVYSGNSYMYFIEDNANQNHVFIIFTNSKGIRKDDLIMVHGVIAGKTTYPNTDGNKDNAVMLTAMKKNIENAGASGK